MEVDIVLYAHHSSKEERTHQAERNRKDYRQRNHITLVQTCQDEVDKQDTDTEDDGSIVAFGLLLTSNTGVVIAISHRQNLLCNLCNGLQCLTRRTTLGSTTRNTDCREHIESLHTLRSIDTLDGHELTDWSHLLANAHEDVVQRVLVGTIVRVSLNTHLIELGKFVETGRHRTSVVTAQYLQNLLCRGACTLTLYGIHGELILRIVWLKCGINRANLITLLQSVNQAHCNIVQLLDCTTLTILQVECKSSRSTEARNHRRG